MVGLLPAPAVTGADHTENSVPSDDSDNEVLQFHKRVSGGVDNSMP